LFGLVVGYVVGTTVGRKCLVGTPVWVGICVGTTLGPPYNRVGGGVCVRIAVGFADPPGLFGFEVGWYDGLVVGTTIVGIKLSVG
jgi:hypothetical protein